MSARRSIGPIRTCSGDIYANFPLIWPPFGRREARLGVRHAEVRDARDPVGADEDVVRRDVAMHEVLRRAARVCELMRGVEARERVEEDPERHVGGELRPLLLERLLDGVERGPLHVLHDEKDALFVLGHVDRPDDVRVADPRGEARLVEEHVDALGLGGHVRVHDLDRHQPLKAAYTERAAEVHCRHASRGDHADYLVPPAAKSHGRQRSRDRPAHAIDKTGRAHLRGCPSASQAGFRGVERARLW
jgi:hypothetical protein